MGSLALLHGMLIIEEGLNDQIVIRKILRYSHEHKVDIAVLQLPEFQRRGVDVENTD
jgi:hypothetical protein